MSSHSVLARLSELGVPAPGASSLVDSATATRVKDSFGQYDVATEAGATTPRQSTRNAGAVKPSTHPDTSRNLQRRKQAVPVVEDHQVILARFGSQFLGRPNPLFSWAKANFLAPFERHEADDLARSVGQKMRITIEDGALEALFEAAGGRAFRYRHLASAVVNELPFDTFHRELKNPLVMRTINTWRHQIAVNMREMLDHVRRYSYELTPVLQLL